MGAAALAFSFSVVAEGWVIFLGHDGVLDFAYLNKRLYGELFLPTPIAVAYFLLAYAAFSHTWRRRESPITLEVVCWTGAATAALPAAMLLAFLEPVLAVLAIGLGAGLFGLVRIVLTSRETRGHGTTVQRRLVVSAIFAASLGMTFTVWLTRAVLWRAMDVDYFIAREGASVFT